MMENINTLIDRYAPAPEAGDQLSGAVRAHNVEHAEKMQSALIMIAQHEKRDEDWVRASMVSITLESLMAACAHPVVPGSMREDIKQDVALLPGFDPKLSAFEQHEETHRNYAYFTAMMKYALMRSAA